MKPQRGKTTDQIITAFKYRDYRDYPFKCPKKDCDQWFQTMRGALNHYDHHVREEYGE